MDQNPLSSLFESCVRLRLPFRELASDPLGEQAQDQIWLWVQNLWRPEDLNADAELALSQSVKGSWVIAHDDQVLLRAPTRLAVLLGALHEVAVNQGHALDMTDRLNRLKAQGKIIAWGLCRKRGRIQSLSITIKTPETKLNPYGVLASVGSLSPPLVFTLQSQSEKDGEDRTHLYFYRRRF